MAENENMEQATQAQSNKAEKAQKDTKSEKKSKPSIFSRVGRWLREMKSELKKVQWPTAKQTANNTVIVILCVIAVGVFIWLFDFIASSLINALIALASSL
jgi:preprotein translocase subunit SecE